MGTLSSLQEAERYLSARQRAETARCSREDREDWVVTMYRGNRSAFSGYHFTPSEYSELRCKACGRRWRTRAG